jgi:tRNA C32,U32 (ribose-2'-O)-methylase TrmJ
MAQRRAGGQVPVARDHTRESRLFLAQRRGAVQVLAYELALPRYGEDTRRDPLQPLASFEELERFYEHLERTLLETGFLNPGYNKKLMPRLRRLFGRSQLEKEEISILRGMLKSLVHPEEGS